MSASDMLSALLTAPSLADALKLLEHEGISLAVPLSAERASASYLSLLKLAASRCRTPSDLKNELERLERARSSEFIQDDRNSKAPALHRSILGQLSQGKPAPGTSSGSAPRQHAGYGHFLGTDSDMGCHPDDVEEICLILRKRTKNNVILCAPSGAGKTTLVEAIAAMSPPFSYFSLDLPRIIAGTKYRGELEAKLVSIFEAAIDEGFVVFIDEIHSLATMGNAEGSVPVMDLLKPYLTRPDFRIIGATTPNELPALMTDPAFRRRFSVIRLTPLTRNQLVTMARQFAASSRAPQISDIPFLSVLDRLDETLPEEGYPEKLVDYLEYCEAIRLSPQASDGEIASWTSVFDRFVDHRYSTSSPFGEVQANSARG